MSGPYALDFNAVLSVGAAQRADMSMLADLLPAIESVILSSFEEEGTADG